MKSNNEDGVQNEFFAKTFESVLLKAKLTPSQLAEATNLSRTNFSKLKKGARPRTDTLIKICNVLLKRGLNAADLAPLIYSGLGLSVDDAFYRGLPKPLHYEGRSTDGKILRSRYLITDMLAERFYPDVLEETLENLNHGVEYFYFLPRFRCSREWGETLSSIIERDDPESEKLLREIPYVISCPDSFIHTRYRIDNMGLDDCTIWTSVGESSASNLYKVDPSLVLNFTETLRIIVQKAKLARQRGGREILYKEDWIEMTFELAN